MKREMLLKDDIINKIAVRTNKYNNRLANYSKSTGQSGFHNINTIRKNIITGITLL